MASIAETSSLFEIDEELDGLLEEIEGQVESEGHAAEDLVARFQQFCEAHGEKVDRIGRFVRIMEAREQYCRSESARLTDRARTASGKVERPRTWCSTTCSVGTSKRSKATSSHCARKEQPGFSANYRRSRSSEVILCERFAKRIL